MRDACRLVCTPADSLAAWWLSQVLVGVRLDSSDVHRVVFFSASRGQGPVGW